MIWNLHGLAIFQILELLKIYLLDFLVRCMILKAKSKMTFGSLMLLLQAKISSTLFLSIPVIIFSFIHTYERLPIIAWSFFGTQSRFQDPTIVILQAVLMLKVSLRSYVLCVQQCVYVHMHVCTSSIHISQNGTESC